MLVHQAWRWLQRRSASSHVDIAVVEDKLPRTTEVEVQAGVVVPFVRIMAVRR
jgi:hypothetical protein